MFWAGTRGVCSVFAWSWVVKQVNSLTTWPIQGPKIERSHHSSHHSSHRLIGWCTCTSKPFAGSNVQVKSMKSDKGGICQSAGWISKCVDTVVSTSDVLGRCPNVAHLGTCGLTNLISGALHAVSSTSNKQDACFLVRSRDSELDLVCLTLMSTDGLYCNYHCATTTGIRRFLLTSN